MRKLSLVLAIVLSVLLVQAVQAHPADVYFQTYSVSLSPAGMGIIWEIKPGALLAQSIWNTADQNQDQAISQDEVQNWVGPLLPELQASFENQPLPLTLQSIEWPSSLDKFRIGDEPIRIHLAADWPPGAGQTGGLTIEGLFAQKSSVNWFKVSAAGGTAFETPDQQAGTLILHIAFSAAGQGSDSTQHWSTAWESGQPSIPAVANSLGLPANTGQIVQQQGLGGVLGQLIRSDGTSPFFFLAALALALVTGALHALTPGHGKTIVAAYLVGSRGTIRHAIFLGATVTLTHTGSVFVLGAVMLVASQYILPTTFVPVLEVVSGLLIIGLGGSLLYQRWRAWRRSGTEHHHDHYDHDHHHDGHTDEGDHDHHQHPDPSAVTWRTLLALGISGGLVPCPEAIAILLLAVTINRIALGLALILAFSLGLAIVLIAIGIAMVKSKQFVSRFGMFDRWAPVVPMLSALVVLGFGIALTVGALQNTAPIPQPTDAASAAVKAVFDLRQARVAFTAMDAQEHNQLFVVAASGGKAQQLTNEPLGILDYSVAPDGKSLVYSGNLDSGGTDLWELDSASGERTALLSCADAFCSDVMWSTDTSRILYSRLDLSTSDPLGVPSVWWLQLATHETGPAFQDGRMPLLSPSWSTDGTRLAYTPVNSTAIQIYDLGAGAVQSVPTRTGSQVIWSPAGDALLLTDVKQSGAGFPGKLFRYDLASAQLTELTAGQDFYEYDPAWSPDGQWISMLRHDVGGNGLILGDQIWLVHPDGSQLHQITQTDGIVHGRPVWSPDGRYLLYHYLVVTEHAPAKIQILDVETGQTKEVTPNGYGPTWLP